MADFEPGGSLMTTAPPPPPEVKIRTMRSDIAALAASGGNLPQFENVKIAALSAQKESSTSVARTESKSNLLLIVLLVITLIALMAVGWFVYLKFFAG